MVSLRLWSRVLLAALWSKSNQEFYDRIAPVYDQCFVTHRLHAINMAAVLLDGYKGQENNTLVLDLGCGTGLLGDILAGQGFKVIAIDISLESLRVSRKRESKLYRIQANAMLLPFVKESCNAVVSLGAWRHFSDPRQVIEQVARLLKKDGVLILGYFPPAIGGVIQLGNGFWSRLLVRVYQFVIRRRGYMDNADLSLEPKTLRLVNKYFTQVGTIDSGKRWHLIVARGLR